jgi:hypothetical protein
VYHSSICLIADPLAGREPLNQLICISSNDPQSKLLNDPAEVMMNLRVHAKLPIKMCKIGGPYIKDIFLTSNVTDHNTSLRVLTQTAGAKTEMMECLVTLIGPVKLAKCSMRVSDWTWRDSPTDGVRG